MRRRTFRRRCGGFTFLETLVALVLLGVVLLGTLAILGLEPRVERRVDAHREALRLMEMELETLRAASSWPDEGELDLSGLPRPARPAAENLRMFAEVDVLPGRRLRQVTLRTRYTVHEQLFERTLEVLIFNP